MNISTLNWIWMPLVMVWTLAACNGNKSVNNKTVFVGPTKVNCVGVGPMKCLQIRYHPDEEWKMYYQDIDGFSHQEGVEYELLVEEYVIPNPPADGSNKGMKLIRIVNQAEAANPFEEGLANTSWRLKEWGDPADLTEVPVDVEVTMEFEEERVAGSAGCNRYFSSYTASGGTLSLGPAGATRKMCPPEIMEVEDKFLKDLESLTGYELEQGQLILTTEAGMAWRLERQ
ncbi:META domain-containing protein [Pontibacter sp. G13]|uniref:META domain-containing protein n=1 Tax=Pontibacter sp. G13 TaxID=3074898 RepID=UPI00288A64E0|nr:META domain-containing protein [Pontibacter sp. G13]WNJ19525.1 META domain-containing protein [Pontibacter sp. G13]